MIAKVLGRETTCDHRRQTKIHHLPLILTCSILHHVAASNAPRRSLSLINYIRELTQPNKYRK